MGVRSDLDASFDFEIVNEFLDHYSMMVESMEVMINDLSKINNYTRSINELFRVFHDIKSATGYFNLLPIARLASFVEDELEALHVVKPPVNEETILWLLDIADIFSSWKNDLKMDNNLTKLRFSLLKIPDLEKRT